MKNQMKQFIKNTIITAIVVLVLLMGGCGESVDPTMADVKLEMKAHTHLSSINTNARVMNSGIEFTEVLIGVTEIEFESMGDNHSDDSNDESDDIDDESNADNSDDHSDDNNKDDGDVDHDDEIEFEGQFVVDLLNGTSDPDFGIADVIPGVYKELEIKISPILEDGNSIFVAFTYQPEGSEPVNVELSTNKEIEFEIENHSGIQLDGNSLNQILVLFDLNQLLTGVDFNQASMDVDGIIRINSDSNADIAALIWANLDNVLEVGEDEDGDHDIDDDHSDDD